MAVHRGYSDEVDAYLAMRAALCPKARACEKCWGEVLDPSKPCSQCGHTHDEDEA